MIGKELRGWRVSGLIRYLFGPAQSGLEHENPRVVASWDGDPGALQPAKTGPGEFDVDLAALIGHLDEPLGEAGLPSSAPPVGAKLFGQKGPIWHTPLRAAPEDRVLTDAEWREIAEYVMDATGIAARGDAGAPRWIAVRHDDESIHLVATLVRQDTGRRVHPRFSKQRLRNAANQVERDYGLRITPGADRTAAARASRAEAEKAQRRGVERPERYVVAERVARCAATAQSGPEFVQQLQQAGLQVRTRRDAAGTITGYAVAGQETTAAGETVFWSGRRLAPDLSWPQLQARWASSSPAKPPGSASAQRAAVLDQATSAVQGARAAVRSGSEDPHGIGHATADVLHAAGAVTEPGYDGPWSASARGYDRAARTPGTASPPLGHAAQQLRTAAWQLAALGAVGGRGQRERGSLAALVAATSGLLLELAAWHQAAQRAAQTQACHLAHRAVPGSSRAAVPTATATDHGPRPMPGPRLRAAPDPPGPGPRPPTPR